LLDSLLQEKIWQLKLNNKTNKSDPAAKLLSG